MSGEFGLAALPEEAEGRHRKAAPGQSSAGLDPAVSLLCSAPPQIPALPAITRGRLALDLCLVALDSDPILLTRLRATTHYIPLLPLARGHKYFSDLDTVLQGQSSLTEKQRGLKRHQMLNGKVCYPTSGSWTEFCCKGLVIAAQWTKRGFFFFRKPLQLLWALTWSIPHHQALAPDPQLSLGTFTQISSFLEVLLAMLWF